LVDALHHRIAAIDERSAGNAKVLKLVVAARQAVTQFENDFKQTANLRKKALAKLTKITRKITCSLMV